MIVVAACTMFSSMLQITRGLRHTAANTTAKFELLNGDYVRIFLRFIPALSFGP